MWRPVESVRMQRWRPGAKTTEVQARVALVCASNDNGRPFTGSTNLIYWRWLTVVDWVASGSRPCISKTPEITCTHVAHDFSVKLSPCMCSYIRLTWLDTCVYLSLVVVLVHVCVHLIWLDSDESCCVPWQSSKSAVYCLLRLDRPMMMNLTSYIKVKVLWNFDDGSIHL